MGILSALFERRSLEDPAQPITSSTVIEALSGPPSVTGRHVTPDSAMRVSAVFACVRVLAETISSLPLHVYRRLDGGGKERDPEHPLYRVLHDLPNPEMTSVELRENLVGHVALRGNAYCEIERDGEGNVRALWPLRPDRVRVEPRNGRRYYVVDVPGGPPQGLEPEKVWHIRGFGTRADSGLSPIACARESVGLALATEEYGARFYANDSRPGGVLKHPGKLSPEGAKNLKQSWEAAHGGLSNAHRVAVLEEGVEWQAIGIAPEDAQYLEMRQYQVLEIARLFRVPPHLIGDLSRATYANIEHQSIEFVTHTIRPWLVRIEQAIARDLFRENERSTWFAEHLVDGLLRGDIQSRYNAYAQARQNGWMSANDIREIENMNPVDGGDIYLVPLNMVPAEDAGLYGADDYRGQAPAERRIVTPADLEQRAVNYVVTRRRIARAYRTLVAHATEHIVGREEADIMRRAEKMLRMGDYRGLVAWLETFYQEHPEFYQRYMLPVLTSLAEQVQANAAEQIAVEADEDLAEFLAAFTETAADRYCRSHFGQLRQVLEGAEDDKRLDALQERFDEWGEKSPAQQARIQTVRAANAVTKQTWANNGVQRLTWITHGESCPYCNALRGKSVAVWDSFLAEGQDFQPDGAEKPLRPHTNIGHPPAHDGCDCGIAPG